MINRYYKLMLFNGFTLLAFLPFFAYRARDIGSFCLTMFCFVVGLTLVIAAPALKDPPPTYAELQEMMRGFYKRMLN